MCLLLELFIYSYSKRCSETCFIGVDKRLRFKESFSFGCFCLVAINMHFVWAKYHQICTTQIRSIIKSSSVQSLDRLGRRGGNEGQFSRDPLPVFFLQEPLVISSGMGRDVHFLILSSQHFLCRPQHRQPSKVPRRMVLDRLLWLVICPNHASFHLLTVARRGSCGRTGELILLRTKSLVLCSK